MIHGKESLVAKASCQNDELFLSIAEAVGRKAYFMGVDMETKLTWYSAEERIAFYAGWLEAEEISLGSKYGKGGEKLLNRCDA
jgi:hypothetical protein